MDSRAFHLEQPAALNPLECGLTGEVVEAVKRFVFEDVGVDRFLKKTLPTIQRRAI
jgi:hypothetical protein